MNKHHSLDQLFNAARNQQAVYTFSDVRDQFVHQNVSRPKSTFEPNQAVVSYKFWVILCFALITIAAMYFYFTTDDSTITHPSKTLESIQSASNQSNETQQQKKGNSFARIINRISLTTTQTKITSDSTLTQPAISIPNDFIYPTHETASPFNTIDKLNDPYIFPKLTEIEIKATQKQKKVMLKALEKMDKKSYAFITSGSIDYNGKKVSIQSFIMQKTEVSNLEYRTFLFDLLIQDRKEEFLRAKPDQQQWNK